MEELLKTPQIAAALIAEAKAKHGKRTENHEEARTKDKIAAVNSQLEALAERIAALPKSIDPEPFYKQMEKIQEKL